MVKSSMWLVSDFISGTAQYSRDANQIALRLDALDLDQLPDFNIDSLSTNADMRQ